MNGAATAQAVISVQDVSVRFGGIVALDGVGFEIRDGEVTEVTLTGSRASMVSVTLVGPDRQALPREIDVTAWGPGGSVLFDGREHHVSTSGDRATIVVSGLPIGPCRARFVTADGWRGEAFLDVTPYEEDEPFAVVEMTLQRED